MFNYSKLAKWLIGLAMLALFCLYLGWATVSAQFSRSEKQVEINRGDNFWEIAQHLKSAGIIKSRLAFMAASVYRGSFLSLKAGQYLFEPGLNLHQILARIERGEALFGSNEVEVTLPEGLTLSGIARKLREVGFNDANDILKIKASSFAGKFLWLGLATGRANNNLEGFLFPDTYRFSKDASIKDIAEKMLARFDSKTAETRNSASGKDFYNILKLASILEEEVLPKDMPLASGVLWKRLELGMPLQVDATLVYELGRPIRKSDITSLNSPYNTYKYQGLPPTPISNPGLASLVAALHPQKSNYLYYLSRPSDKTTFFSETLEEHNLAKAKYLNN